jgi:hypothetical protein
MIIDTLASHLQLRHALIGMWGRLPLSRSPVDHRTVHQGCPAGQWIGSPSRVSGQQQFC